MPHTMFCKYCKEKILWDDVIVRIPRDEHESEVAHTFCRLEAKGVAQRISEGTIPLRKKAVQ